MRGYVERMEWLERFSDEPVTHEDVIDSYLQDADQARLQHKYEK